MPIENNKVVPLESQDVVISLLGRDMKIHGDLTTSQQIMARSTVAAMDHDRFKPDMSTIAKGMDLPEQVQGALAEYTV